MTTWKRVANNRKTTLSADLTDSAIYCTVADGTQVPTTPCYLTIWDRTTYPDPGDDANMEVVICTVVAGNTLTITRGQDNTSAHAHSSGHCVACLNNAGQTQDIQDAVDARELALTISTGLTRATNTITADLSTGIAGGQTLIGGTAASDGLTIRSTSHATKGTVSIDSQVALTVTGSTGGLVVGTDAPWYRYAPNTIGGEVRIRLLPTATDAALTAMSVTPAVNLTTTTSRTIYGDYIVVPPVVTGGVTSPGPVYGSRTNALRGYVSGGTVDSGTLTSMFGDCVDAGHFATDVTANPTTTNVYVLAARAYIRRGVITNLYGLYIPALDVISTPSVWPSSTALAANAIRRPTVANGCYYIVTTAGTTGGSEPTWSTTPGGTTADNSVTWTTLTIPSVTNEYGIYQASPTALNVMYGNLQFGADVVIGRTSANVLGTVDTIQAGGYQSSDGSTGATQTCVVSKDGGGTWTLVFKNGLLTSAT